MKTWLVSSDTNYGLYIHVVNAETSEEAILYAKKSGAWDGCWVEEIDTTTEGVVAWESNTE